MATARNKEIDREKVVRELVIHAHGAGISLSMCTRISICSLVHFGISSLTNNGTFFLFRLGLQNKSAPGDWQVWLENLKSFNYVFEFYLLIIRVELKSFWSFYYCFILPN